MMLLHALELWIYMAPLFQIAAHQSPIITHNNNLDFIFRQIIPNEKRIH
uniref:Uncharacterized protein n=1 Tax=Arundo donax TaxID=35708 RepID=A0A0A9E656_ARUDO